MKKETIEVLKNFASINQGILIRKGNELRTMSVMKEVFGTAVVEDTFDNEFAIYDLNEFLSSLSLFDAPELDFDANFVEISQGKSKVKYFYSSPTVIVSPPADKKIKVTPGLEFNLTAAELEKTLKAAAVLKLKELEISDTGLKAYNKSTVGNVYTAEISGITGSLDESKTLSIENIKFLPRDYKVTVGNSAVKFTAISGDLEYIVAVQKEDKED